MSLSSIKELSNRFGSDPAFVLAGGGNSSYKDGQFLYIKPSGVALARLQECDFVKLDRAELRKIFAIDTGLPKDEREKLSGRTIAFAVVDAPNGRRPSVEAPLHELMPFKYVLHLHPALVNGMCCGKDGQAECARLFPDSLWIGETDPGCTLAKTVYEANRQYEQSRGRSASLIFLQNHGVFVAADDAADISDTYEKIMDTLREHCRRAGVAPELACGELDPACVAEFAPRLRGWLGGDGKPVAVTSLAPFQTAGDALTPDHIVYAKSFALTCAEPSREAVEEFERRHGYKPLVVEVPGKAVFCAGATGRAADTVAMLAKDAGLVQQLTAAFGGTRYLSDAGREFIENWEAESYRRKNFGGGSARLSGKIAVITGGAQGFGFGIAKELADAEATVVIADLNAEGAQRAADAIVAPGGADAVAVDISNEDSIARMTAAVVARYGGIDLFVANAGVLKAGSVKSLEKRDWDFVTAVNYSGYFLCVKHVSQIMSIQNLCCPGAWSDIVQVNSKSGLAGSNRNGAYAGSKFGTIGLTQSFALELVADRIKVNSVCPGNFFDGPLWSDPERGLFVQYLNSGKVPGAKSVADVKLHYEKQIPMHRGCYPADVAKAIIYAVEQPYETGQAIPVTGGQVMLN